MYISNAIPIAVLSRSICKNFKDDKTFKVSRFECNVKRYLVISINERRNKFNIHVNVFNESIFIYSIVYLFFSFIAYNGFLLLVR